MTTEVQIGNEVLEEGVGKTVDGDMISYNFKFFRVRFKDLESPDHFWMEVAFLLFLAPAVALHEIGHVIGATLVTYGYCWAGLDVFKSARWVFWGAPMMNLAMIMTGMAGIYTSYVIGSWMWGAASIYWTIANIITFASSGHDIDYDNAEIYQERDAVKDFRESRDELYNENNGGK